MTNKTIGNYYVQRLIGEGGMGSVYLGVHRLIGGRAAIKVLQPQLARNPEMAERFLREAKAARCAEHPGIVRILDYGMTEDGLPYLAMEYIDGQPLSKYLAQQQRLAVSEMLRIGQLLASALASAHQKQVVHRDLKPDNVMRVANEEHSQGLSIKIVDFGIARIDSPSELKKLTRTGAFLGTPCYMALEVLLDPRRASDRSDVYALGIILFQMLVGEPPFMGNSLGEVVLKHLGEVPPLLSEQAPGTPSRLCKLVASMLAKDPQRRPSMKQVGAVLSELERSSIVSRGGFVGLHGQRPLKNSLKRWGVWLTPSLLIGAGALALTHRHLPSTSLRADDPAPRLHTPTKEPTPHPAPALVVAVPVSPIARPQIALKVRDVAPPRNSVLRRQLPAGAQVTRPERTSSPGTQPPPSQLDAAPAIAEPRLYATPPTLRNPFQGAWNFSQSPGGAEVTIRSVSLGA